MPERPEDTFDHNRNFAAIREALPVEESLYQRLIYAVEERWVETGDENYAAIAVDVVLRFVLFHQVPPHALYAHNKQRLTELNEWPESLNDSAPTEQNPETDLTS